MTISLELSPLSNFNVQEIISKGLNPLDVFQLNLEINIFNTLNRNTVCIYDMTTDEVYTQHVYVPRIHERELWVITENSFTDNMDNETFTYFKYELK
jgi:hypothetical protein